MFKSVLLISSQLLLILACKPSKNGHTRVKESDSASHLISIDSANKMIGSYLGSLSASTAVAQLRSISFKADQLRAYLADSSITDVKISLAHSLAYINSGHVNLPAGYNSNALTMIISAVSANGNYVFSGNQVMDFGSMCPSVCLPGEAANALFPIP